MVGVVDALIRGEIDIDIGTESCNLITPVFGSIINRPGKLGCFKGVESYEITYEWEEVIFMDINH